MAESTQQAAVDRCVVHRKMHSPCQPEATHMSYEWQIPQIDVITIFHICCSNFKVGKEGATPFPCKTVPTAPVVTDASPNVFEEVQHLQALRTAEVNVVSNIGAALVGRISVAS